MPNPSVPFSTRHTEKHLHKTMSARTGGAAGARVLLEEGREGTCAAQLVSACHISFSSFGGTADTFTAC